MSPTSSQLLSQEEIDALVTSVDSDGDAFTSPGIYRSKPDARSYDLASEDSALVAHLGALDMISDRFSRMFRVTLATMLHYQPFPAIFMGIFSKRMNREGAIAGMVAGLTSTFLYIAYFKLWEPAANTAENWLFGISPEGIGVVGMVLNFAVAIGVARMTAKPPAEIDALIENIRVPRGAGAARVH